MRQVRHSDGTTRVRLETWGEVAHYLGVEIRTAQRWERRMGLPIHRLDGSQAVFAFEDELQAWHAAREKTPPTLREPAEALPPAPPADDHPPTPAAVPARARRHWRWAVATLVPIAIAVGLLWRAPGGARREAADLVLQGTRVVGVDAAGTEAWTHELGRPAALINASHRPALRRWWQRMDADGDGHDEIIALVVHPGDDGGSREVLYCFELDGGLRFAYEPDVALTFRDQTFSAPWVFQDIEPVPAAGGLWIALGNSPWWPGVVMSLDARGAAVLRYVQPGVLGGLAAMTEAGRPFVLAYGVNNEYAAASVALLDPREPPATAPQAGDGPFQCVDCPRGLPVKYLLLPPSPLNKADGAPYNRVEGIEVGSRLTVTTYESTVASIIYEVSRDLKVTSATVSDSYRVWRSSTPRPARNEAGDTDTIEVRTWTESGWSFSPTRLSGVDAATTER